MSRLVLARNPSCQHSFFLLNRKGRNGEAAKLFSHSDRSGVAMWMMNHDKNFRNFHFGTRVLNDTLKSSSSELNHSKQIKNERSLEETANSSLVTHSEDGSKFVNNMNNQSDNTDSSNTHVPHVKFETKDYFKLLIVSILGGCFGGMVGLGGNIILIPLLTQIFSNRLSAKQIVATCLLTVVTAGLVGSSTLYFKGDEYVDIGSAILIAGFASLTARFGVKLSSSIQDRTLKLILAFFMLFVAPLVLFTGSKKEELALEKKSDLRDEKVTPLNANLSSSKSQEQFISHDHSKTISDQKMVMGEVTHHKDENSSSWIASLMKRQDLLKSPQEVASLFVLGSTIGVMSGLLGVGGGVLTVPMLSFLWLSEFSPLKNSNKNHQQATQQLVMGTSLAAMTLPSTVALCSHWRVGNVLFRLSPFLVLGSALGAYIGSSMASEMDEEMLKRIFAMTMVALGGRQFWKAWKK